MAALQETNNSYKAPTHAGIIKCKIKCLGRYLGMHALTDRLASLPTVSHKEIRLYLILDQTSTN